MSEILIRLDVQKAMLIWGMLAEHDLAHPELKAYDQARTQFNNQVEKQFTEEHFDECRHAVKVDRLIGTMPNILRNGKTPQ